MRACRLPGVLCAVMLFTSAGCAKGQDRDSADQSRSALVKARPDVTLTVSSAAELKAAVGKNVRLSGILKRSKLGARIWTSEFSVMCKGARFQKTQLGARVRVEGRLEHTGQYASRRGPHGERSAGTDPGTKIFVLRECRNLPPPPPNR